MRDFFERYSHLLIPEPNSGCLIWMGAAVTRGYGHFNRDGKHFMASRCAYECVHGDGTLYGLKCCHTCDFPPCCEPNHLFQGSQVDNALDMIRKGRCRSVGHSPGPLHPCSKLTSEEVVQANAP